MEALFPLLSDVLSKKHWHSVVKNQELIEQLPSDIDFKYWLISKSPSGDLEYNKDKDYYDCVSDPSSISTSESCMHYLLQMMGYIHECDMCINEFFGLEIDYRRRDIEPGILFEYFLLLVQRYFELTRVDAQDLYDLSEDDGDQFEEKKKVAQVLLNMLNLASTDFEKNPHILPKLHALIDSVMLQYPDAMCLVILAKFSEIGFESLYFEENTYEGMQAFFFECPFREQRMFQTLDASKDFPISSFFTPARLCSTFACLLKNYCEPIYNEIQGKKAIVNVCAFLIKTLSTEAAFDAIEQIFTQLEKKDEMVLILEAILAIESEHLRGIVESPEFPIHLVESLKRLEDYIGGDFVEKYKLLCKKSSSNYPKDKLKGLLKLLSEKSFVAGIIFARLFNKSYIERGRKLAEAFNASVCERIQSFIDHSKILDGCKEGHEELRLRQELRALKRKIPEGILLSSRCGNKTTISAALEHLRKYHQSIHEARQAEWKAGGVALQTWESRFDDDADSDYFKKFPRYQMLTSELNQIDAIMSELQKYKRGNFLNDFRDENTKDIERVNAQIKVFDDQKHQIRLEHTRLLQEAKTSILERLFGAQE
jgi:hypothetical protein